MHYELGHSPLARLTTSARKVIEWLVVFLVQHNVGSSRQLKAMRGKQIGMFTRDNRQRVFAVLLVLTLPGLLKAEATHGESNSLEVMFHEIEQGVYVRFGQHKEITAETVADIANHGFIVGETGVAVIDPGGSVDVARQTMNEVKKITSLPVTHVIVTHVHPDHSLGLVAYVQQEDPGRPIILGHPGLAAAFGQNLEFFKQRFDFGNGADQLLELIHTSQITPVDTELTFDLGNREIAVTSFSRAHSDTDMSIYDRSTRTLWAGDLLFVERTPAIDGSVLGWLDALNQLSKLKVKTVIPGHGASGKFSVLVQPQLNYLEVVLTQTRDAIARQVSLKAFIADESQYSSNLRSEWKLFDTQHELNLSRAYAELEWE